MKLQVTFNYKGVPFKYTVSEQDVDMAHYDDIWDCWMGEDENENKQEERIYLDDLIVFEFTGAKKFMNNRIGSVISGDNFYVNVYHSVHDDDPEAVLAGNKVEVRYM